jgi:2-polyprenyl-6-methoxyphenol hydroxylase-like FAD-dependent oxidoreductase
VIRARDGRIRGAVLEDRQHRVLLVRGDVVIGADGARSTVASLVGAEPYRVGAHASGVVYGYWRHLDVTPGRYHWHYAPGVTAGVIPTNDGWCLFVSVPSDRFLADTRHDLAAGYRQVLVEVSPTLAAAVDRAEPVGRLHGFAGQVGHFRRSHGPGWALVGDAGYFKDPITAHGMTDALRDADLLADAVADGSPAAFAAYERTRDALSAAVFDVTDEIARCTKHSAAGWPRRSATWPACRSRPWPSQGRLAQHARRTDRCRPLGNARAGRPR